MAGLRKAVAEVASCASQVNCRGMMDIAMRNIMKTRKGSEISDWLSKNGIRMAARTTSSDLASREAVTYDPSSRIIYFNMPNISASQIYERNVHHANQSEEFFTLVEILKQENW
jgi:hypothetical protein